MGLGPMTGRAAGYCAGYNVPGFLNRPFGGGGGRGGHGWRNRYYATGIPGWARGDWWSGPWAAGVQPAAPSPEQALAALKAQAQYYGEALADIERRIASLEKEAGGKNE